MLGLANVEKYSIRLTRVIAAIWPSPNRLSCRGKVAALAAFIKCGIMYNIVADNDTYELSKLAAPNAYADNAGMLQPLS